MSRLVYADPGRMRAAVLAAVRETQAAGAPPFDVVKRLAAALRRAACRERRPRRWRKPSSTWQRSNSLAKANSGPETW